MLMQDKSPFSSTLPGISSIEVLLPLLMELVDDGILDIHKAIEKVSSIPSKILNIENRILKKMLAQISAFLKEKNGFLIQITV